MAIRKTAPVYVSGRGQITLPSEARKKAGIQPGDALSVTVEEGRIILSPVDIFELERYTDERIEEFAQSSTLTKEELAEARRKWGL